MQRVERIFAVLLGVFPGIGGESDDRVLTYDLTTNEVAVDNIGATETETRLLLRNNFLRTVEVNDLSVNGLNCETNSLPLRLKVGQKQNTRVGY